MMKWINNRTGQVQDQKPSDEELATGHWEYRQYIPHLNLPNL